MSEPRYIPRDQWDSLPVQPPVGRRVAWLAPLLVSFLVTIGLLVLSVFIVRPNGAFAWIPLVLLAILVAQGLVVLAICALVAKPYRLERELGYTTWGRGRNADRQMSD